MTPISTQHSDLKQIVQDMHKLASFHGALDLEYPQAEELQFLHAKRPVTTICTNEVQQSLKTPRPSQHTPPKVEPKEAVPVSTTDVENCREGISRCSSCPHRTPPKFGVGAVDHPFIFIISDRNSSDPSRPMEEGEESLLGKMLQAIKIKPHQIFVTNIIKCKTDKTDPAYQKEMAANCLSHTRQQIRIMQPAMICTMGQLSSQAVLQTTNQLMALRGHFHTFMDLPLMATYHPAQLLTIPELKKAAWYDLQLMQRKLAMGANK